MKSFKHLISGLLLSLLCCSGIFAQTVGINTDGSLPATLFHTKNTTAGEDNILRIENTIGNREAGINLLNSTTANANWKFYVPASSNALRLYNGSDLVTFLQNGNVGIGTSSPTASLHINSSDAFLLTLNRPGYDEYDIRQSSGFGLEFYNDEDDVVELKLESGNVGIGTTTPSHKLDVAGSIRATSSITFDVNGTVSKLAGSIGDPGTTQDFYIGPASTTLFSQITISGQQTNSKQENFIWWGTLLWDAANSQYNLIPVASQNLTASIVNSGGNIYLRLTDSSTFGYAVLYGTAIIFPY